MPLLTSRVWTRRCFLLSLGHTSHAFYKAVSCLPERGVFLDPSQNMWRVFHPSRRYKIYSSIWYSSLSDISFLYLCIGNFSLGFCCTNPL